MIVRNLGSVTWAALALCCGAAWLSAPPAAGAPTVVSEIAVGSGTSCAVTTAGAAQCWGWNSYGELGVGTSTGPQNCGTVDNPIGCSATPVGVSGLGSGVSEMGVGYSHACARMTVGGVRCWGNAVGGALGNGNDTGPQVCGVLSFPCSTMPATVGGLDGPASALAVGWNHTCAVTGGVECWGGHRDGALGNGSSTGHSSSPVAVDLPDGVTVTAIGAGEQFTCAVTSTGGVLCWGSNRFGQLGSGTSTGPQQCGANDFACSTAPVAVDLPGGVTATEVAVGGYHACALTSSGAVLCWGWNSDGQLGIGTDEGPESCSNLSANACSTSPIAVSGLGSGVTTIRAGHRHTCALTTAGGVKCWGDNYSDQLGLGPGVDPELCGPADSGCSTTPVTVSGLTSGASGVAAGWDHTCALTTAGGVKCWGNNNGGGLGTGNRASSAIPGQVVGLPGAWTLSVSVAGAGSGTITSTPAGIDCGGAGHTACSVPFAAGSTVQLRSNPGAGLAGFAGAGCGGSASICNVTMSSAQSVTATFALPPSASISAPAGGGTYTVGQPVATSFACAEGASGPGLASCEDSRGIATVSGGAGQLDTSTAGLHVYTVTAVSGDGLTDSASIAYRVLPDVVREPDPKPRPSPGPVSRAPTISIRGKSARVVHGRTTVKLACGDGALASDCRGTLIVRRRGKTPRERIVLGRTAYAIQAGETRLVRLRLSKRAIRLIDRTRGNRLRAEAIVTVRGGRGARLAIALRLRAR
jgi:alpha-tubulin suppressor-like RCC1 family protein